MSEQSEDSTNNSEPPIVSLEIVLKGLVSVPGTLGRNDDGTYGIYAPGLQDSLELAKYQPPNPLGVRRLSRASAAVAAPGEELDPEEPNLTSAETRTAAEDKGNFNVPGSRVITAEDLTLLNVSRSMVIAAEDQNNFNYPRSPLIAAEDRDNLNVPLTTMLSGGGNFRRIGGPSHALDVIQPYPGLTAGCKRARCPSPTLEPMPECHLKKVARDFSLSSTPDGIPMAACEPLDEEVKGEEASLEEVRADEASVEDVKAEVASVGDVNAAAAKAEVRARVLGRIRAWVSNVGKDKAVLAQEASGATQQEVTAEAQGEATDWEIELIDVGESWNGKEDIPQVVTAHEEARDGK